MTLFALGINHQTAPVALRERVAFGDSAVPAALAELRALRLALAAEERAERFFADLVRVATNGAVRDAARELQAEEQEHVRLVRAWMKKVPKPDRDWAVDPDPPRYTD